MRIAALQLAGGLLVKLVYVPSEDNPADAPSRGVVRRWRPRTTCVARTKRQIAAADAKRTRVRKAGLVLHKARKVLRREFARQEILRREIAREAGLAQAEARRLLNLVLDCR